MAPTIFDLLTTPTVLTLAAFAGIVAAAMAVIVVLEIIERR